MMRLPTSGSASKDSMEPRGKTEQSQDLLEYVVLLIEYIRDARARYQQYDLVA